MSVPSACDDVALPEPRANRPVRLGHRAEYGLALALCGFFRLIGVDAASAVAGVFTRSIGPLLGPITNRARTNLRIAYPDMPRAERERLIRDVWENLGRTAAEFAHLGAFDPDARVSRVAIEGRALIEEVAASGKAAIFVSGHFANWEIMAISLQACGVRYGVIYRAANNPLVDALIIGERARVMSRRQIPKGKRGGRDMIETLKSGASLAMLVDQKLNTGGIVSPFLGLQAMTAPAPARLALRFGCPIIPLRIERAKGARFRIIVRDPIEFSPSGEAAADAQSLTDLINREIETMIRAAPKEWLWLHRRYDKALYRRTESTEA